MTFFAVFDASKGLYLHGARPRLRNYPRLYYRRAQAVYLRNNYLDRLKFEHKLPVEEVDATDIVQVVELEVTRK